MEKYLEVDGLLGLMTSVFLKSALIVTSCLVWYLVISAYDLLYLYFYFYTPVICSSSSL